MREKKRVLVLGATGMLGNTVYRFLRNDPDIATFGTNRGSLGETDVIRGLTFDAESFVAKPSNSPFFNQQSFDYVINCIGIIKPFCKDDDPAGVLRAIRVNSLFPHLLAERLKGISRVIQIATDCVFSGKSGGYAEKAPHDALDVYGKSKSLGEVRDGDFLNIRCSIIGPERDNRQRSLLEWFLGNPDGAEVKGFTHHLWNGVTTLQFADLCARIVKSEAFPALTKASPVHHFVPNEVVNKAQLLQLLNRAYGRKIRVVETDSAGPPVDRTIATEYSMLNEIYPKMGMGAALEAMRNFQQGSASCGHQAD
jgi:dTDP-4-dehydrorhamnose reductase